jgi:hypothetical protein
MQGLSQSPAFRDLAFLFAVVAFIYVLRDLFAE